MATGAELGRQTPSEKAIWAQMTWWVLVVPLAMGVALAVHNLYLLDFSHILAGLLWTGADLFLGFIVGPVIGRLRPDERRAVIGYLVPRTMLFMPVVAATTTTAGWFMATWLGFLAAGSPQRLWIYGALVVTTILSVQGFGILLPNEVRIYFELKKREPDVDRIVRLNQANMRLSGVQGLFQVVIILIMAHLVVG